jgi:hypothetical protein
MPLEKPLKREEDKTPTETVIPLGLTIEQYARFCSEKAANASQSAKQSANLLAEHYERIGTLASEVQNAQNNARDAKIIGLAIAAHFKIDLTQITLTPSVSSMPAAEKVSNLVTGPRKKMQTHPSYHPPTAALTAVFEDEHDSQAEITGGGNHVVVEINRFKSLSLTEKQYEQMKLDEAAKFAKLKEDNEKKIFLERVSGFKKRAINIGWMAAGGVLVKVLMVLLAPHL